MGALSCAGKGWKGTVWDNDSSCPGSCGSCGDLQAPVSDGLTPSTPGRSLNDKARGEKNLKKNLKKKRREEKRELAGGFVARLPNKS